jgi:hypothetical protein
MRKNHNDHSCHLRTRKAAADLRISRCTRASESENKKGARWHFAASGLADRGDSVVLAPILVGALVGAVVLLEKRCSRGEAKKNTFLISPGWLVLL